MVMPTMAQNYDEKIDLGCNYLRTGFFKEAFQIFKEVAMYDDAIGHFYVAECYAKGYGVAKDDKVAFSSFRRVAERGLPAAQAKLAYILYKGLGTAKNVSKANYWIGKATNYENIDAYTTYILGLCYEEGLGRQQDMSKAMDCFQKACSKNIDDALIHTAWLFSEGRLVKRDYSQALSVINNAIENIGSGFDYACKGRILKAMGNNTQALNTWQTMVKKCPAYALNGKDRFTMYMRGQSPIPQSVIKGLYAKTETKPQAANNNQLSYNALSSNKKENNIIINYTTVSQLDQQTVVAQQPAEEPQGKPSSALSNVDSNIPTTEQPNKETFAIIIANEQYQDVADVPYAINDGESFGKYCQNVLGLPTTNVHLVKNATFNNMRREISWLKQVATAFKGDAKIIVYYAGHGIPDESSHSAYLLPVDGIGSDVSTGYSLDELYKTLGDMPAKSVTVLLDACFSGAQRDGSMLASARGVAIKAKQGALRGNMVVFSAAQGDETAYPYKEQGHGMFTYYLLKKLQQSKGNTTLGDLIDYVSTQVERQSVVLNGKIQTPTATASNAISTDWKSWKLK